MKMPTHVFADKIGDGSPGWPIDDYVRRCKGGVNFSKGKEKAVVSTY
jgi:hypothetical protein